MPENDASTFGDALDAVRGEREYQDALWGPTDTEGAHSNTEFLVYIRSYTNEALETLSRKGAATAEPEARESLRKIATLAIQAMVQNGVTFRSPLDKDATYALAKRRTEGK